MTIGTTDIVAPVFATAKVVVFLSSRVAPQTSFGNLLGRFVLEGNDLGRISFFNVRFARAVTRFAAGNFVLPTTNLC